ncbi:MAG: prolyl oligopeptidase family serine peptidase, partial [Chloroflexota bacterium]
TVRRLTFGPRADSEARWSPDGKSIAFVSDRDEAGKPGLFVIDMAGGEARRVPEFDGEVSQPRWSPIGDRICFLGKDVATPQEKDRTEKRCDPVVAEEEYKYSRLYTVPASGGTPALLGLSGKQHVTAYDWFPDGKSVVVAATDTPSENDTGYGPTRLIRVTLDTEQPNVPVKTLETGITSPLISPDGALIAFLAKAGRVTSQDAVWVLPSSGGESRCVTPDLRGSADAMAWSSDSQEIRFVGFRGLRGTLQSVQLGNGEIAISPSPRFERAGSFEEYISFDRSGNKYAAICSTSGQPANVWSGTFGQEPGPVTDLNQPAASLPFAGAEEIEWESADGTRIQGLLYRPLGFQLGTKYPLVVEVHGGPAWLWADVFSPSWRQWPQLLAARGFAVLLPNPRGSVGRGHLFTDLEVGDMGGGELNDILSGVDHVVGMGFVDENRLGIGGWSHGGYLSSWAITQTNRFRAAVVGAGVSNLVSDNGLNDIPGFNVDYFDQSPHQNHDLYWKRSPLAHIQNVQTPTLVLHGEKDERVTQSQGQELYRALRDQGVEATFVTYPREKHAIAEREHQLDLAERVIDWFQRHLGNVENG